MLWVCAHLPHLAMELRQPQQPGPFAVTDGTGARRQVIACNQTAREAGIAIGMDAPSSMMREPELQMFDRSKADERRATLALASWAHQFTSDVCVEVSRWMVWMEVGSSLRYFNSLTTIYNQIRNGIERLGGAGARGGAPAGGAAAGRARRPGT